MGGSRARAAGLDPLATQFDDGFGLTRYSTDSRYVLHFNSTILLTNTILVQYVTQHFMARKY